MIRTMLLKKSDLNGFRLFQLDLRATTGASLDDAHHLRLDREFVTIVQQDMYKQKAAELKQMFKSRGVKKGETIKVEFDSLIDEKQQGNLMTKHYRVCKVAESNIIKDSASFDDSDWLSYYNDAWGEVW